MKYNVKLHLIQLILKLIKKKTLKLIEKKTLRKKTIWWMTCFLALIKFYFSQSFIFIKISKIIA